MIPDGDVEHGFIITKLNLLDIKLESLRFVTVAWIGPNLLRPPVDNGEQKQDGDEGLLGHVHFVLLFDVLDVETARL